MLGVVLGAYKPRVGRVETGEGLGHASQLIGGFGANERPWADFLKVLPGVVLYHPDPYPFSPPLPPTYTQFLLLLFKGRKGSSMRR